MANLPTSIKNLNTLLGEQLTEGGGGGSSDWQSTELLNSTNITVEANPQEENGYIATTNALMDFSDGDFANITMTGDVVLSDFHSVVKLDDFEGTYCVFEKYDEDSSIEAFYYPNDSRLTIMLHGFETAPSITSLKIEKIYKA